MTECDAGRTAFFDGTWTTPCPETVMHHIGSPAAEPIRLCDIHFQQVLAAGLVTDPNLPAKEFEKREKLRTGRGGLRGVFRRGQDRG